MIGHIEIVIRCAGRKEIAKERSEGIILLSKIIVEKLDHAWGISSKDMIGAVNSGADSLVLMHRAHIIPFCNGSSAEILAASRFSRNFVA